MFVTKNNLNEYFCLSIFLCMFLFCDSKTGHWKSELLYVNDELGNDRLETGNTFLILPIIYNDRFDTGTVFRPEIISKRLKKINSGIEVVFKEKFEKQIINQITMGELDSFYNKLFSNKILKITSEEKVWQAISQRYVMLFRINKGVRISSFDGILKRKAEIESELWDTRTIEIIWRSKSSGYEMDRKVSDAKFILKGLLSLLENIPEIFSFDNKENW